MPNKPNIVDKLPKELRVGDGVHTRHSDASSERSGTSLSNKTIIVLKDIQGKDTSDMWTCTKCGKGVDFDESMCIDVHEQMCGGDVYEVW